ncbi:MAG TPA: TolC family protein, partial [Chitinophagaceae bacterium]|nr:TolC family protein [Chitinophagaceae bacterium]
MRRFFLPILFLLSVDSFAQKKLTLEEAIATALSNNFDIQLSRNDSIVAALNYGYKNAAFYPRLNANTGVVFNNNDQKQKFSDGTVRERNGVKSNNLTANLALNWTLFDGLRMFATRDKVAELVKLGELGIKEQLINTVASVINTYYNIVKQKQQLRAIEEQMSISQERVKLAQYKLDIGVGAKPDVLQSKVDLNAQKAAQLEQQTLIRQLKDQLSQLMNTPDNNYDVSDSIPLNKGLVLTDIQSSLDKTNPSLQLAQKNIQIAGLTLKEIKADRFPVVAFNANYNFNKLDNKAVVNPFQPLNSRNKGFNYGLTATIPIFNNYNVKRQIQQAERDIVFRKLSLDNQKSQISLAVLNAWNNYQWQKQALDLEEESIVLARENVDIVFQVYKLNSTTLIQLKEAQKSLQDAQTRLINARYNTKLAETELLRLKGEL